MSNIKLCVFDLDGTLLNSNKEITKETLQALQKLKNKNIQYTIATGRIDILARRYQKQIKSNLPIISCNGSLIRDLSNNILYKKSLDFNIVKNLVDFYNLNNLNFMLYTETAILSTPNNPRLKLLEKLNLSSDLKDKFEVEIIHKDIQNYSNLSFLKSLTHIDNREKLLNIESQLNKKFKNLSIVSSDEKLLDIMPPGVNKGTALHNLCKILDIDKNEIIVFGDNFNDIEMINFAHISVVPSNSEQHIKNMATYVTKSNDDNGIAFAINEFILKSV